MREVRSKRERDFRCYHNMEPAKKKVRLQQMKDQKKRTPPVFCSCGSKFTQPFSLKQHLFGSKNGRNRPSRKRECVAKRQAQAPPTWWSDAHPNAALLRA